MHDSISLNTVKPQWLHFALISVENSSTSSPHSGHSFIFKVGVLMLAAPGHLSSISVTSTPVIQGGASPAVDLPTGFEEVNIKTEKSLSKKNTHISITYNIAHFIEMSNKTTYVREAIYAD